MGLNASAKSFYPGQPAQSAQADLGRNVLLKFEFLDIKGIDHIILFFFS